MVALDSLSEDTLHVILDLAGPASAAALGLTSSHWARHILCSDETGRRVWHSFAKTRWGAAVSLGLGGDGNGGNVANGGTADSGSRLFLPSGWYTFYRHRSSEWRIPSERSPLNLIQECYANDPYKLLTACILCSRTSGSEVIRAVVRQFFEKYRTPTDVMEADILPMAEELLPLGLNRERTMKRFAAGFVRPWQNVTELHGCGAFAASSHAVWCCGDWRSVLRDKGADRNVRAYASFCRRVAAEAGDGAAAAEEEKDRANNSTKKKVHKRGALPAKRKKPLAKGTRRSPRARQRTAA